MATTTADITPKSASVTPNPASKYCGQDDPELSGSLNGFIESDNVTATYSISGTVISATLSPSSVLSNYDIIYNTAVFTVNDVNIDASASSTPVPLGQPANLSATVNPGVANVSVTFTVTNEANVVVYSNTVQTDATGNATASFTPASIGVLKVTAVAGDACSESTAYIPVYDASGSFVTGGGWIMSPAGAYKADEDLFGKANFGFVSKYKKGSSQVDGNTEFQFKAGDLNFKSTLHESGTLVISGKKATYRGEGTINGQPGFKFTLVALDGDYNGGSAPDEFRIKIWGNSGVIYDNGLGADGLGADDNSDAATTLGGGSIVIHEAKGKGNKRVVADLVEVPWNTPSEVIEKKIAEMGATWFEGKPVQLNIETDSYNSLQAGFYEFKAGLAENDWFTLEEPITINVLVADKPMATDIQLSNSIIQKDITKGAIIGDFNTIDPVDNQHTYSIVENENFEVRGQALVWVGNEVPTSTKLTVFSTDRAGQTIERSFELNKEIRFGDFNMFPNPAHSNLNIEVELGQSVNVGIRIFDAVGRLVYEEEGVKEGTPKYQINIDHLSPGLYSVQLKTGQLVVNKRLIKK